MENATSAILVAVGTVIGLVIKELVQAAINWKSSGHTRTQAIRQDTLNEYKDLLDRYGKRIAELERSDVHKTHQNTECEKNYERAVARIEHLEEALTREGIAFKPWVDKMTDSSSHNPLPKEGK